MLNHFIFAALLACAILVMFRSTLKESDFTVFSGEIIEKKIEQINLGRKERYALVFELKYRSEKPGIFIGTKEQARSGNLIDKIKVGETYQFWMDPTVMASNNINLGIRKIAAAEGTILYEARMQIQFWISLLMTIFIAGMWRYDTRNKQKRKMR